jgi:hypothetical protein
VILQGAHLAPLRATRHNLESINEVHLVPRLHAPISAGLLESALIDEEKLANLDLLASLFDQFACQCGRGVLPELDVAARQIAVSAG